ncbi:uncharacterized protein LOC127135558 isoform X1 [Lathyrus oleraceus]|uniref:F-box domain-containing protein n=1 Tax=Pisum sativum TaxID=3888 RepID=A0A9D5AT24_PEA|nr:uncharacterized protein LOC127135558 isoform X1 [Pisum sativum]KAI5420713.1 hypothetical protein KIW84_044510 [Pisum sativum]
MESTIVKKKRTMRRRKPKSLFNNLPIILQTEIFRKLYMKEKSNAMCVSHSWRNLILTTTLPTKNPLDPLTEAVISPSPYMDIEQLFNWCSLVMGCRIGPKNLIDTCNGLLLFCHKDGQADNIVHGVYHYYVMNPVTKQCVAVPKPVPKPVGQTSGGYSYAALAYDNEESWFFKIVRFQGHRHINIFSSMTGIWTTLTIYFPEYINDSFWVKKSVYLKCSIYRLSSSGHLLRIKVDPQENVSKQTEVIELHPNCLFDDSHRKISLRDGKIFLVLSRGVKFMCFELIECVTDGVSTYTWHMNLSKENKKLLPFNTNGEFLSICPSNDMAFFKIKNLIYFYLYSLNGNNNKEIGIGMVRQNRIVFDYIRTCGQQLFECFIPFACGLEKENKRKFQRLFVPK